MLWSRIEAPRSSKLRAGVLVIDRTERRVTLAGRPLELSPLLLHLVERLAERPGQVVSRAELKHVLWPYAERIDTERRLNTAMRALRVALGDDAEAPRYIETVRSHGYRWIAHSTSLRPRVSLAVIAVLTLALGLSPRQAPAAPDLAALLKAQSAMEEWRRQPSAATAHQASALLGEADPDMPSVLVMRAELELGSQWRWSAAERDYQRASAIDPANVDARLGLAWLRVNQGRRAEALSLVRDLLGAGVLSGDRRASLGWLLIRAGRPDLAAATCGNDRSASTNDLSCSHEALAALGHYADAKTVALLLMERAPASAADLGQVARMPPRDAYRDFLAWRARHFLPSGAPWFQRAQVLADAGDSERTLRALQRSVAKREPLAIKIASTPGFAGLRGDPRFDQLVSAVGA